MQAYNNNVIRSEVNHLVHEGQYNKKDIEDYLDVMKNCVLNNKFTIEVNQNRLKNKKFIEEYNLKDRKQKEILLGIEAKDFCCTLKNRKPGYEHELLYLFCPRLKLFNILGEEAEVQIYIKFNLIKYQDDKKTIVISFHEPERKINYYFK